MINKNRYISLFVKSAVAFIFIGLFPLLIMGLLIYRGYMDNIRNNILDNSYIRLQQIGDDTAELLETLYDETMYLYEYGVTDYDYFYQFMLDEKLSNAMKDKMMTDILKQVLYTEDYIRHVYFVTADGKQYSAMRQPMGIIDEKELQRWHDENFLEIGNWVDIIPTHRTEHYRKSNEWNFTVSRNIMNTQTLDSAEREILGTIYVDVSTRYFEDMLLEKGVDSKRDLMIIDKYKRALIYSNQGKGAQHDLMEEIQELTNKVIYDGYYKCKEYYLLCSKIQGTSWIVAEKIPTSYVESDYNKIRINMVLLILISGVLLVLLYIFYSKITNRPIRKMKETMDEIQAGNLEVRADIHSNDEIGILAEGLDSMTEKLQQHIKKVYIAEIRQREAQIEAMTIQIQPHYLYNTLDVIRMSAITHDDNVTAQMLESLSFQMRYLLGDEEGIVTVKQELECIENYFKILKFRYENSIELEIHIEDSLLNLKIPKLTLQPIVENSLKYGIIPRGNGAISIEGQIDGERLLITVIDDGIGMDKETLENVKKILGNKATQSHAKSKSARIGMKNVSDRIQLHYGCEYGLEISSSLQYGTLVKIKLPLHFD